MISIKGTTKTLGIIGNPVAHSLSPQIHNFLGKELDIDVVYVPFFVEQKNLKDAVNGAFALSIEGLNITVPFKQDVCEIIKDIEVDAKIIGAVNTLKREHYGYKGFNTDIYGMLQTFKSRDISLKDKTIIILGAGGSAHTAGVLAAKEKASKIIIANRTKKNAISLAEHINKHYNNIKIEAISISEINSINYADILIQTTPFGMSTTSTQSLISDMSVFSRINTVFDIIYSPSETELLKAAKYYGAVTINGFDMLIYQAVRAFEIWNDVVVDDKVVLKLLKLG